MNWYITPENDLERTIVAHPDWIAGMEYGEPRPGHPEGKVGLHVRQVLKNVDRLFGESDIRMELRTIAMVHDAFKYKVDRSKQASGDNHHGRIASRWLGQFVQRLDVLAVVDLHDEAFNAWMKWYRDGSLEKAEKRASALREKLFILGCERLFLSFYRCDNETGDKDPRNFAWFNRFVEARL